MTTATKKIVLTDQQQQAIALAVDSATKQNPLFRIGGFAGTGKLQPLDAAVQTPDGLKEIGTLKIGDKVFGVDGNAIQIEGIFPQGIQQVFRVTFRDGSSTEAGGEHLWAIYTRKVRYKTVLMTTDQIIKSGLRFDSGPYKYSIPLCQPVQYERKQLLVHPYLIGAFIGDGTSLGKGSPALVNPEIELVEKCKGLAPDWVKVTDDFNSNCPRYRFTDPRKYNHNGLAEILNNYGLGVKSTERRIPKNYLYSSIDQRLDLLRGLMDTDGS
jgi:phosphate starvation-inducible PhoH-like protein